MKEIRKLSENSKQTAELIRGMTKRIESMIFQTTEKATVALDASQEQVAATQEITARVGEMANLSEILEKIAAEL